MCWPWERSDTPEREARYRTRAFWFWSRQVASLGPRERLRLPPSPPAWLECIVALRSGNPGELELDRGLESFARMLCAGEVKAPWQLGLQIADFRDSFEDDMGYIDAFRLWGMSVFDDAMHLRRYLDGTRMPATWETWVAEQFAFG